MNETIQIPGFEIIEKLGAGGMAIVWKARQVSLDRVVAVKIMHTQLTVDPSDVQRFQSEAQAAAKLKHPGIIQVYDANVENGMYYFVMEFVAGYTVGDWVRRKGPLSEKDVLLVADCVADALEYAWNTAKIIHCDIKPDNVMIDADGTVKVADLGLARTMNAMTISDEMTDEILGTPSYISPEQATGVMDLDFRADIYSLGAMLYHLITGKIMFAGESDDKVLELQVSGTVTDPLDINPHITKGMCAVLEKMLAKKREDRYASWELVRADLAKVKRKTPFVGPQLPDGASTMKRGKKRSSFGPSTKHIELDREYGPGMGRIVVWAVAAVVVILSVILVCVSNRQEAVRHPPSGSIEIPRPAVPQPSQPTEETYEQKAQKIFESAKTWAANNPDKYDEIADRYSAVVSKTRGTQYVKLAQRELEKLRPNLIKKIMAELKGKTDSLVAEKKYAEAAEIYEKYTGKYGDEVHGICWEFAAKLRDKQKQSESDQKKEKTDIENKLNDTLDQVVFQILSNGPVAAGTFLEEAMKDSSLASMTTELDSLRKFLIATSGLDRRILSSFKKGDAIELGPPSARRKFTVIQALTSETDNKILIRELIAGGIDVERPLELRDLDPMEKIKRMGAEDSQEVALARGLLALKQNIYGQAKKYFGSTHPLISARLIAKVEAMESRAAADGAKNALIALVRNLGIASEPYEKNAWIETIGRKKFSRDSEARISESIAAYRKQFGKCEFADESEVILKAIEEGLKNIANEPASVAGQYTAADPLKPVMLPKKILDAVGNSDKVLALLLERNPDLAATDVTTRERKGMTIRIDIASSDVADILPVAALKDLREFSCERWSRSKLSDLAPLRGLPLEYVNIRCAAVADLSSLQGMQIKDLIIAGTDVADLRLVVGMPLEKLNIGGTKIKDLSPLKGMKISELDVSNTKISDFSMLSTMPLERLDVSGNVQIRDIPFVKELAILKELNIARTKVADLSPLKGLPLTYLNFENTPVRDLSPIKELKLNTLCLAGTAVWDISVLKNMPITTLIIGNTPVRDFSVIKSMPLKVLNLSGMKMDDISSLKDSQLESLDISNTKVQDLSCLSGLSLRFLNINGTSVRDLRHIASIPLTSLNCANCNVDLAPLRRSSTLEDIWVDLKPNDDVLLRILRSMPKLRSVNGQQFPFARPRR